MFIGITGLHGAGKTYFCNTVVSNFGFKVFSKKVELLKMYKTITGRNDWIEWYRNQYKKDPKKITEFILSNIGESDDIIFDAVHSPIEWEIIKLKFPKAELIEIITPYDIRLKRTSVKDIEKDKKRIEYWHSDNNCLLTNVSWAFNGDVSKELNIKLFEEFLKYIKDKDSKDSKDINVDLEDRI